METTSNSQVAVIFFTAAAIFAAVMVGPDGILTVWPLWVAWIFTFVPPTSRTRTFLWFEFILRFYGLVGVLSKTGTVCHLKIISPNVNCWPGAKRRWVAMSSARWSARR